jgi:hypothetical protein
MGKKADRQIAKAAKKTIRGRMPTNWTLLPKAPPAAMMATGHCLDARLLTPITEVELAGHRKILIQSSKSSPSKRKGRNASRADAWFGIRLCVMWDSMRNVDSVVAECARLGHVCPNIILWYVALLRRLTHHPDAADSSRIWAAQRLLDRENLGMDKQF